MNSVTNPKIKPHLSGNNAGASPSPARGEALFPVEACLQAKTLCHRLRRTARAENETQ